MSRAASRRSPTRWLASLALAAASAVITSLSAAAAPVVDPPADVVPGRPLAFPRDHGSHPDFRTEWWYVTGWLQTAEGEALGFQVTFFRTRPDVARDHPSRFAPRQILIAHAAISDPARGHLWKAQHLARAGFGLAEAEESDAKVWIDDWRFARTAATQSAPETWIAHIPAGDFILDLELAATQPHMANGRDGFSQKGPAEKSASWYYSVPHLRVSGRIERGREAGRAGRLDSVTGEAWLDHEWSSEYLDPQASGWDWIGLNLDDGGALMAFRIRDRAGGTRWAGGSWRDATGRLTTFTPADIHFEPGRRWRSPRTGIEYPIEWRVRAGALELRLEPLMDDQESDTRASTGAIYWEGAVRASDTRGVRGRGYLELTGYGERLRLR